MSTSTIIGRECGKKSQHKCCHFQQTFHKGQPNQYEMYVINFEMCFKITRNLYCNGNFRLATNNNQ